MTATNSTKQAQAYDLPTPEPDSPALTRSRQPYRFSTLCATVDSPDGDHKDQHGSSSVPIYQTATFKGVGNQYDYTRSGNPTRTHLGELVVLFYTRMCIRALCASWLCAMECWYGVRICLDLRVTFWAGLSPPCSD